LCGGAQAEDAHSVTVTIRDHRFEPAELHVPAGKRILLTVINADPLSEEFDSTALKVEKVIAGKSQGVVHISRSIPAVTISSVSITRKQQKAGSSPNSAPGLMAA
jgi:Cupredoxin-like domain